MFSRVWRSGLFSRQRLQPRGGAGNHGNHGHAEHAHGDHGHHSYGQQPEGFLFNLRPGERYKLEGWEIPFYVGMVGSIVLFSIAYSFRPDTSLGAWAEKEAQKRIKDTNARF